MRPDFYGLKIAPSIPSSWDKVEISKDFRGAHLSIKINNPGGAESGFKSMTVNGTAVDTPYIPADMLKAGEDNEVEIFIS